MLGINHERLVARILIRKSHMTNDVAKFCCDSLKWTSCERKVIFSHEINHTWWSRSSFSGRRDAMSQLFSSVVYHTKNVFRWKSFGANPSWICFVSAPRSEQRKGLFECDLHNKHFRAVHFVKRSIRSWWIAFQSVEMQIDERKPKGEQKLINIPLIIVGDWSAPERLRNREH